MSIFIKALKDSRESEKYSKVIFVFRSTVSKYSSPFLSLDPGESISDIMDVY